MEKSKFITNYYKYSAWVKKHKYFSILLAFYTLITSILYLHYKVRVFDEAWFFSIAKRYKFENTLGYGSLYWAFLHVFHNKLVLRLFALASMLSMPVVIYKFGNIFNANKQKRYLLIILWLTFPASWWYGKLIAPELYCLALGIYGLYFAFSGRKYIGYLLMGIAAGVKAIFIIFPFFYFVYQAINDVHLKSAKDIFLGKRYWIFYLCAAIGFIIGSPNLLFHPLKYLKEIHKFSAKELNIKIYHVYTLHLGNFWETVINPSLMLFSLSFIALLYLIYCLIVERIKIRNYKLFLAYCITFIISVLLVSNAYGYFSWFWYPIIILTPILFYSFDIKHRTIKVIIILNLLITLPVIFIQVWSKAEHIKNCYKKGKLYAYIEQQETKIRNHYQNYEKIISIDPPTGTGILDLNEYIKNQKMEKPIFFAISKIMMVKFASIDNPIHYIRDMIFSNKVIDNFKEPVFALKNTGHRVEYLGMKNNMVVFMVEPARAE